MKNRILYVVDWLIRKLRISEGLYFVGEGSEERIFFNYYKADRYYRQLIGDDWAEYD